MDALRHITKLNHYGQICRRKGLPWLHVISASPHQDNEESGLIVLSRVTADITKEDFEALMRTLQKLRLSLMFLQNARRSKSSIKEGLHNGVLNAVLVDNY